MTEVKSRSRVSSWAYAIRTTNPPPGADRPSHALARGDPGGRAANDAGAGLVAGLLARPAGTSLALARAGPARDHPGPHRQQPDERPVRHPGGTDSADYPRALYSPHPVLSGLVSRGA